MHECYRFLISFINSSYSDVHFQIYDSTLSLSLILLFSTIRYNDTILKVLVMKLVSDKKNRPDELFCSNNKENIFEKKNAMCLSTLLGISI